MPQQPTIDDVKEFWDARPCNIRHSDHPVGTKEYFDQVEQRKFLAEPHIITFSDFTEWRGRKVLEIGCGIGTAAVNFARHGADYTGIDLSSASLELAKKRFKVYDLPGRFFNANAEQLSQFVPEEKFDLIYSWGVIHHTPDPPSVIEEIKKYMHKDSIFKIMIYAQNSWKNFMIEAGLDQPEAQYGCPIALTYDEDGLRDLLGPGFDVISIEQDHIFPYEIESYKRKEYVLQPWFRHMPKDMFRVLEKHLGWHLMATAKLKETR